MEIAGNSLSAKEFEAAYAKRSGITVDRLRELGRVVPPLRLRRARLRGLAIGESRARGRDRRPGEAVGALGRFLQRFLRRRRGPAAVPAVFDQGEGVARTDYGVVIPHHLGCRPTSLAVVDVGDPEDPLDRLDDGELVSLLAYDEEIFIARLVKDPGKPTTDRTEISFRWAAAGIGLRN